MFCVLSCIAIRAQVGINSPNPVNTGDPTKTLALKVEGTSNSTTTSDDVVITKAGFVGVAVANPLNALEIAGSTNVKALQLKNQNSGNNKFLVSDGSGNGTWQDVDLQSLNKTTLIIGNLTTLNYNVTTTQYNNIRYYTGCYIDLPNGSWEVYVNFYMENGQTLPYTEDTFENPWVRTFLSNGTFLGLNQFSTAGTLFSDITAPYTNDYLEANVRNFLVSSEIYGPSTPNSTSARLAPLQGRMLIKNESGATKRYYLLTKDSTDGGVNLINLGSTALTGNLLYAVPYKS